MKRGHCRSAPAQAVSEGMSAQKPDHAEGRARISSPDKTANRKETTQGAELPNVKKTIFIFQ